MESLEVWQLNLILQQKDKYKSIKLMQNIGIGFFYLLKFREGEF